MPFKNNTVPEDVSDRFVEWLKEQYTVSKKTLEDFSNCLGYTPGHIAKVFAGHVSPSRTLVTNAVAYIPQDLPKDVLDFVESTDVLKEAGVVRVGDIALDVIATLEARSADREVQKEALEQVLALYR